MAERDAALEAEISKAGAKTPMRHALGRQAIGIGLAGLMFGCALPLPNTNASTQAVQPNPPAQSTRVQPNTSTASQTDVREFKLMANSLSYDDYLVALNILDPSDSPSTAAVRQVWGETDDFFRGFAAVYVARECLAGHLPSGEGFIAFVVEHGKPYPRVALTPLAQTALADLFRQESSPQARSGCLRMYFAPVDGTELRMASELTWAPYFLQISASTREAGRRSYFRSALAWFTPEVRSRGSLLRFLCEGYPCLRQ